MIRIIQTVKQWQRLRPYLSRNSWVEGFYYVSLSMYNILSRTWQHDTRNVAMILPGRVQKYVYVYTLDIPHSDALPYHFYTWRSFSFSLVRVPSKREPNEVPRLSLSMDVKIWIIHHPSSSIILHLHPSKTNGKVLKSLEIHLTFRSSSAWRIHASPVTSCSCSHYDLHLSCLSCYFFLDGVHRGPTRRHGRCLKILQGLTCSNCPASRAWWLHPRNML